MFFLYFFLYHDEGENLTMRDREKAAWVKEGAKGKEREEKGPLLSFLALSFLFPSSTLFFSFGGRRRRLRRRHLQKSKSRFAGGAKREIAAKRRSKKSCL